MNWPPLTPEGSKAIADVLRDAVDKKPRDLFEHVAQQLAERSGIDTAEFEAYFEECKRKPRTYVLEDQCPANQDPLTWVPARYNDDTILLMLQHKSTEIVEAILSQDPQAIPDARTLASSCIAAFPELMYLSGTPEELYAFQLLRALQVACTDCQEVLDNFGADPEPEFCFKCGDFLGRLRDMGHLEVVTQNVAAVEALMVVCVLHALGRHEGFCQRYGGGHLNVESAVLHAMTREADALPSYQRLSEQHKALVHATLQVIFPLESLLLTEVCPAQYARAKERLEKLDGGLQFLMVAMIIEHMVLCREVEIVQNDLEIACLGIASLGFLEKYSPQKAYEIFLKKRAERHSWRLLRDDHHGRAAVRICCFAGNEDDEAWFRAQEVVNSLNEGELDVLVNELGHKDGVNDWPAFSLDGAGTLMAHAQPGGKIQLASAVRFLIKVLKEAAKMFDRTHTSKVMKLQLVDAAVLASTWSGEAPFEETPLVLEDLGHGDYAVRVIYDGEDDGYSHYD
jgi:hypothetical protein